VEGGDAEGEGRSRVSLCEEAGRGEWGGGEVKEKMP